MKQTATYLTEAWLVLGLALVFGAALAGVQTGLHPKIEANKRAETMRQIPSLVPGAKESEPAGEAGLRAWRALGDGGETVGWVVLASGQGFAGPIELLVGVDAALARIPGLYVLSQTETPGLGNRIAAEDWREQFRGMDAETGLKVTKQEAGPHEIQEITGATISSRSVVHIVNNTLRRFRTMKEAGS